MVGWFGWGWWIGGLVGWLVGSGWLVGLVGLVGWLFDCYFMFTDVGHLFLWRGIILSVIFIIYFPFLSPFLIWAPIILSNLCSPLSWP